MFVLNPVEKSVQIQIEQFVEKRSSVGLQELEASLASFSASSKDLAKKGVLNKLLMHSAAEFQHACWIQQAQLYFESLLKKITADLLRMIKKMTSELQLKFKSDQQESAFIL